MSSDSATYVLVPGAGGDSGYWDPVASRLRARGHEVIAPDLPCADHSAGLRAYEDVIVAAVGDRQGVILVAQSMAAFTTPAVCARVDVALLVLVAPMIPRPGETPGEWWTSTGQVQARRELDVLEGRDPDAGFEVVTTFLHDLDENTLAHALARGERPQSDTPFADPAAFDAWPDVPTRVLAGRKDRFFPLEFMRGVAAARLGVVPDVIDTGHLPALSRPDELTQRLEGYRAELAPPTGRPGDVPARRRHQ